jgi:hypothetical protein
MPNYGSARLRNYHNGEGYGHRLRLPAASEHQRAKLWKRMQALVKPCCVNIRRVEDLNSNYSDQLVPRCLGCTRRG